MGTTKIAPEKTAAEIQALLAVKGARHVITEFSGGEVVALSFAVEVREKEIGFRLPVRLVKGDGEIKRVESLSMPTPATPSSRPLTQRGRGGRENEKDDLGRN